MSLRHAILVLLETQPASGSDLARRFDSGIGHFWHATHQQIYQELKSLHAEGLAEFEVEAQTDRPDKKVYRLTRSGRRDLKDWLAAPVNAPRLKQALLIKVFGGHLADRDALRAELERHEARRRTALAQYRKLEDEYFAQAADVRARFRLRYLTLRAGIRYEQSWIDWLEEARAVLVDERLPKKPVDRRP